MANDTLISEEEVRAVLAAKCKAAGSMKAWAEIHELSTAYVCDVLQYRRDPGKSILAALGLKKVVQYQRDRSLAKSGA